MAIDPLSARQLTPLSGLHVLLVDDHALVRAGLSLTLKSVLAPGLRVSEAAGVSQALQVIREEGPPDLVLLDIQMPGMDGFDGLALIRRAAPLARVAMVSALTDPQAEQQALERGADGFLLKNLSLPDMQDAVQALLLGQRCFGRGAFRPAADMATPDTGQGPSNEALQGLSARHMEVLRMVAQGHTNKVVGRKLGLAENTVRFYVSQILAKMGCSTRSEAAYWAQRKGLL